MPIFLKTGILIVREFGQLRVIGKQNLRELSCYCLQILNYHLNDSATIRLEGFALPHCNLAGPFSGETKL